ncbi:hypothetical protein [Terriglobus roseus]|uniref:Uncharacterized protein n=1 Tax=Terriglobus roseus TaxID=392734 RepID=A0A1G7P565_9BACT|nr:hypothetical protein [Terriglobus roseus]SDF81351.1 hypothetical protein SAMN05444167_3386 [Terriglobus roseus]
MALDISLGGTSIPTDPDKLQDLKSDTSLTFQLVKTLEPYLQGTLSTVPNMQKTSVAYSGPQHQLTLPDSVMIFGLQTSASGSVDTQTTGSLDILNSGDLGSYTDGLDSPETKSIPLPQGFSYVRLSLKFSLSANVSAKYSGGAYGVKASADTKDTYSITYCKAFPPTTKVIDAIGKTFESFVLPFTSHTLNAMQNGDYLFHDFDGNLNFAIGAYTGVDQVLYAGQGTADVFKAFGSPLATVSASVKPEISASASLDFKMAYEARFEAVLSKIGNAGRLHLFKSDKRSSTTTLAAGLTISLNAGVDLKEKVSDHLAALKTSVVNRVSDPTGKQTLQSVLDAETSKIELQKYADEVTDKLTSWLNKANGLKANLQIAIENTQSKTLLAGYTFSNVNSDGYKDAWSAAIAGDFVKALNTGVVALDCGSGLEQEYQKKTSVNCNIFNLWSMNSWSQFGQSMSLVYAGNNVFHFVAQVGRTTQTNYVGSMHSMDFYFSAKADANTDGRLSDTEITLNLAMNAKNDKKAIEKIALMLSAIDQSQAISNTVRDMRAFATNTNNPTVQLLVKIPVTGFQRIVADPKSGVHDKTNWDSFATAADDLDAWTLHSGLSIPGQWRMYFKTYKAWQDLNVGEQGSNSPDRNSFNSLNSWRSDWPGLDTATKSQVIFSMWAGQRYMDFCADLQQLATVTGPDAVKPAWEDFLKLITKAIEQDTQIDFLRPAALATIRQCKGSTFALTAPSPATPPADHFAVGITL